MFIQHFILCVFNHFLYLKSPINLRCSILGKSIHTQEQHANATQPATIQDVQTEDLIVVRLSSADNAFQNT